MVSKTIARNKKVYFDYFVEMDFETGIVLKGSEVKSIRAGHVNIEEAIVDFTESGLACLVNARIKEFKQANIQNHDPTRPRVLLLKKKEIKILSEGVAKKGYTIKVLSIYLKKHLIKLKIGLCRGKKKYDKREVLKKRDGEREIDRAVKSFNS